MTIPSRRALAHEHQPWFVPESTHLIVDQLSRGRTTRLSKDVEQLALWRLVELRECPVCGAEPGQLCMVFGGFSNLMRTHPARLKTTSEQRATTIEWAQRAARAKMMDDVDELIPGGRQ